MVAHGYCVVVQARRDNGDRINISVVKNHLIITFGRARPARLTALSLFALICHFPENPRGLCRYTFAAAFRCCLSAERVSLCDELLLAN